VGCHQAEADGELELADRVEDIRVRSRFRNGINWRGRRGGFTSKKE
jgi:hypothetical protein